MTNPIPFAEPAPARAGARDVQREAFERLEPRIRGVPTADLLSMNINSYRGVEVALQAAPRFMAFRPRMEKLSSELDLWLIDHCADLAHAFCYASAAYIKGDPSSAVRRFRAEGVALRERLHKAMELVMSSGELQGELLCPLRMKSSYVSLSRDLTTLARFFQDHRGELQGSVGVKEPEIERAFRLAALFLENGGKRKRRSEARNAAALLARQAFTLFCRAYDEVRRALVFLCWSKGSADKIAPSLYAGRNSGGRLTRSGSPAEQKVAEEKSETS